MRTDTFISRLNESLPWNTRKFLLLFRLSQNSFYMNRFSTLCAATLACIGTAGALSLSPLLQVRRKRERM